MLRIFVSRMAEGSVREVVFRGDKPGPHIILMKQEAENHFVFYTTDDVAWLTIAFLVNWQIIGGRMANKAMGQTAVRNLRVPWKETKRRTSDRERCVHLALCAALGLDGAKLTAYSATKILTALEKTENKVRPGMEELRMLMRV